MKNGLVISLLLLAGCATEVQYVTRTVDTGCLWTKYIYPSRSDKLTDGTAKQILEHNETREARCGTQEKGK